MKLETIPIRDLSNGIIQKIDNLLAPKNSVVFSMNLLYSEVLGRGRVRGGTALIGAQIANGYEILGLHQFILSSGTKYLLSVVNGASTSALYRLISTTWTSESLTGAKNVKHRFLTYLDTCMILDGTNATSSADGNTWVTTGGNLDIGNCPKGKFAIEWRDRVWVAGVTNYLDRLYFSTLPSIRLTFSDTPSFYAGDTIKGNVTEATAYINKAVDTNNFDVLVNGNFDGSLDNACTTNGKGGGSGTGNLSTVTDSTLRVYWDDGYIDIEPFEGQGAITGLGKVPGYLLIFKERALKRWNGSSTFPDDLCTLGTPSHESIINGKTSVFFFSSSHKKAIGFYETNGETTRKISRPIQEIVEAISSSNYTSIAGFSDGEVAMWSIGDITYDGIAYNNVLAFFHIESQTWALLSFPTEFKVFSSYIDGTTLKIIAGNDDGEVIEIFTGQKDNYTSNSNVPIQFAVQYHSMELGSRGKLKEISKVVPYVENGLSCKFSVRVNNESGFKEQGNATDPFENEINIEKQGHLFDFRMAGAGLGDLTEVVGFDIITPEISESFKT